MCGCLSCGPHRGPGPKPRHMLQVGIELVTLWFIAHAQSTELHQPGLCEKFCWYFHSNYINPIDHLGRIGNFFFTILTLPIDNMI